MIRVLLTESQIDAEATNFKGRNPLHILANFANENAVAIFDLFLECMPNYPLDKMDSDGNTGKKTQCLKITEKVSFNIASEASYVYILSGQKFIENDKKWSILASF